MISRYEIWRITHRYEHLIPEGRRLTNYQFADLIKSNYLLGNPIVFKQFNIIRELNELYWENRDGEIKIIKI